MAHTSNGTSRSIGRTLMGILVLAAMVATMASLPAAASVPAAAESGSAVQVSVGEGFTCGLRGDTTLACRRRLQRRRGSSR
jgi:hypothetical protein